MEQNLTYLEILQLAIDLGFSERFIKSSIEYFQHAKNKDIQFSSSELKLIVKFYCNSDKSTIYFLQTQYGGKGIYIEYWESRFSLN
jgi:hypothetical protein